jgi:hypothetical protein
MSASEPDMKRPAIAESEGGDYVPPSRRLRREQARNVWLMVSFALHFAAAVALLYFTPLREMILEEMRPEKPERVMAAGELDALAQSIEERAAEEIRANVRELHHVLNDIRKIESDMSSQFATFEQQRQSRAAGDALEQMVQAEEYMDHAAEAIETQAGLDAIDRWQTLAGQAQQRAMRKLEMVSPPAPEIVDAQGIAESEHAEATSVQDVARDAHYRMLARQRTQNEAQEKAESIRQDIARRQEAEEPNERQIKTLRERLERQQTEADEAAKQQEIAQDLAIASRAHATQQQREAKDAQHRAVEALRAAMQSPQTPAAAVAALSIPHGDFSEVSAGPESPIDVAALYQQGRAAEDDIAETFKEVRAIDLAIVRDMELREARNDIDVVRPVRPDLDTELLREAVRTNTRFEAHQEELKTALRETYSMVGLAHRMLEMASQSVEGMKFGSDLAAAEMAALDEQAFLLRISELAMEDVSGRFADMAGMMRMVPAEGEEGEGPLLRSQGLDYEDLTGEELAEMGMLQIGQEGEGLGPMPQLTRDVPAVGARKISDHGTPANWMYVDTWYTLGPFANPSRVNIDREFPPDSLVDLDATYVGKGNRTIRWEFCQSDNPEVFPPNAEEYGIWYAYTELHFDEPRDMLIALGTDDRGILKINGVPVWISSKRLKGWDIDEVWRRVHFRKGINRVLYRVENGWLHIGFSLLMRVPES